MIGIAISAYCTLMTTAWHRRSVLKKLSFSLAELPDSSRVLSLTRTMNGVIRISVDGIIYQYQAHGGISSLYTEVLPRICAMDEDISFEIVTTGRIRARLPTHSRIRHTPLFPIDRVLRPQRLWWRVAPEIRSLVQRPALRTRLESIWHSTYYTLPIGWRGPQVVTVVDMIPELFIKPPDHRFLSRKRNCVMSADVVVCISETTRKDLVNYYGLDQAKTRVVYLGCNDAFANAGNKEEHVPFSRPFLLYIGRRSGYKDFATLFEALANWKNRNDVDLVVVGDQWTSQESKELSRYNMRSHVYLVQAPTDGFLSILYHGASAFVYPSLYEGFGIPLVEAMTSGCPIVASRIPSTLEIAADCPYYFVPGNRESLLAAIEAALSEGRHSSRVTNGFIRGKQFTWDETAKGILSVYAELEKPSP